MSDGPFLGKYRARVNNNVDPEKRGRIRAIVPAVTGKDEPSTWALPCLPAAGSGMGFFTVPPEGAGVWIEYEGGDIGYPIWVGGYWTEGEVPDLVPKEAPPAAAFTLQTTQGNGIVISDEPGTGRILGHEIRHFALGPVPAHPDRVANIATLVFDPHAGTFRRNGEKAHAAAGRRQAGQRPSRRLILAGDRRDDRPDAAALVRVDVVLHRRAVLAKERTAAHTRTVATVDMSPLRASVKLCLYSPRWISCVTLLT